jgi:hypothetical protein
MSDDDCIEHWSAAGPDRCRTSGGMRNNNPAMVGTVGHRQPQSADVTSSATSSFDQAVAEENARVDQLIKGVCRGC